VEEGEMPPGGKAPGVAGGNVFAAAPPHTDPLVGSPIHLPVAEYDPVQHACWQRGQPTPYLHIAVTLEYATTTKKRLKIADALCNCFRSILALNPEDLLPALYLFTGRVAPDWEGVELRVGEATVSGAVAEVTGTGSGRMRCAFAPASQPPPPLLSFFSFSPVRRISSSFD
jgi:DNA ligase-1